ncbi:CHASE2 domain-containing protein [bacterium]|nr:CHASE2 domain-containing protein [bacterium]
MRIPSRIVRERRYLLHALLVSFAIAIVFNVGAQYLHVFRGQENSAIDKFMRMRSREKSAQIFIVDINERAFLSIEAGLRRPLSRKFLAELIQKVADTRPRVLAIDLDLSEQAPEQETLLAALTQAAGKTKIAILYDLQVQKTINQTTIRILENHKAFMDEIWKIPGAKERFAFGYINLEKEDQIARSMRPVIILDGTPQLSFPAAVMYLCADQPAMRTKNHTVSVSTKGCLSAPKEEMHFEIGEEERINFLHTFDHPSAGFVLTSSMETLHHLTGKIVLIGATFKKSKDVWNTPLTGMEGFENGMFGVDLLANSINTLLTNRRIHHVSLLTTIALDTLFGFGISLFLIYIGSSFLRSVLILAGLGLFMVAVSFPLFAHWNHWLDYIATANGVTLHRILHRRHENKKQRARRSTLEGRDMMDWFIKAADLPTGTSYFVLAAEISDLKDACAGQPEYNAFQLVKGWKETGRELSKRFPDARIYQDSRILMFFPETANSAVLEAAQFLVEKIHELEQEMKKHIKIFPDLHAAIGVDRQMNGVVEAIGNACELALIAHEMNSKIIATERFINAAADSLPATFCAELTVSGKVMKVYEIKTTANV